MVEESKKAKTLTLAAKLAAIGARVGKVQKGGYNKEQKYNYIEYAEVASRVRELLDEYRVAIVPNVTKLERDVVTSRNGGSGNHYLVYMEFEIVDGDAPEATIMVPWVGESTDWGDKGVNKAITSATKYFLMRLFNVSEKGEVEADKESPTMAAIKTANVQELERKVLAAESVDELTALWKSTNVAAVDREYVTALFSARKEELGGAADGVER